LLDIAREINKQPVDGAENVRELATTVVPMSALSIMPIITRAALSVTVE
jgi:hypothetical protein